MPGGDLYNKEDVESYLFQLEKKDKNILDSPKKKKVKDEEKSPILIKDKSGNKSKTILPVEVELDFISLFRRGISSRMGFT